MSSDLNTFQQAVNSVLDPSEKESLGYSPYPPSNSSLALPQQKSLTQGSISKNNKKLGKRKTYTKAPLNRNLLEESPLSLGESPGTQGWKSGTSLWENTPSSMCANNKSAYVNFTELELKQVTEGRRASDEKLVNQYKILNIVGCGAYGKIFRAVDGQGAVVAVKVYNKRMLNSWRVGKDRTAISPVMNEIQVMMGLAHPHILPIYEVIDHPDSTKLYISQEYMSKGCLSDLIPITEASAQKYFTQIFSAINYLHNDLNIVHRDLKPNNFLINDQETVKICGFSSAQSTNSVKDSVGTFAFMPPEMHKSQIYPKQADVWALGVSLFYVIDGKIPSFCKDKTVLEDNKAEIRIPESFSGELKELLLRIFDKVAENRITIEEIMKSQWVSKVFCNS